MTYAQKAIDEIEKGNYEEAKKQFAWSLRKDDPEMVYSLAEEMYSLGFTNLAKRAYENLLEKYPEEDSLRTALADILISEDKDEEALNYLSQIDSTSDAYIEALMVSADLYQQQGMFEVSEQKLLEAINLAPQEDVILFALAELYYNVKQYKQATPLYLELIKQGIPEFSRVNLVQRLAMSYALSGQLEKALAYFDQIHDEDLDDDSRFQMGVTLFELKNYEDAIKKFEELRELSPDYPTTYSFLASAYEYLGKLNDALTTLQEGIAVDEYNIRLYQKASEVATKVGKLDLAKEYLITALSQEPDNLSLVIMLSDVYYNLGMHQENIDFIQNYLENDEIDPQLYWNVARSYVALDDYEKAGKFYDAAAQTINNNEFNRDAAQFYRNYGMRDEAIRFAKLVLNDSPNDIEMAALLEELTEEF
ncbi:tetratricopeptide repeat protein [Ligilactobacillus hayakitensis DSM 18933 = JCM 14209]|uniref:Tetratricopeptide repeat protein n=1 Tax=Ligilactobacillus hayakitensis DSM 18933 = JCM 14209 TaxID=1423755 RepID=A0A0R1WMJ6_9LACO|nr:tetratricopeptide repeat protein [Ligilactobacillus hayakitensis]KRM18975.1 tetratricopeptide repeat protein [Ligilactobacillus hayakitensis DSM 18933 = JCM 14209]